MRSERSIRRYRRWYMKLLCLYPKAYRERFGEGMAQIFNDLCRERKNEGKELFGLIVWMFAEAGRGILQENISMIYMQNKSVAGILFAATLIMLLPLLAMQFTNEVDWKPADFAVAWVLLVAAGFAYKLATGKTGNIAYRAAVSVAVLAVLLLVWVNLAVGIIGSGNNPANLMYVGVIAVGVIGAVIARLRPHGMVQTLQAMAIVQMAIAGIALVMGLGQSSGSSVSEILGINGFFAALFLGSAWLFRFAALRHNEADTGNFK